MYEKLFGTKFNLGKLFPYYHVYPFEQLNFVLNCFSSYLHKQQRYLGVTTESNHFCIINKRIKIYCILRTSQISEIQKQKYTFNVRFKW